MEKKKICLIAGSAPTYRKPIYTLIGEKFGCDFILGAGPTKQMDIMTLPNKIVRMKTIRIGKLPLFRQTGAVKFSKGYDVLVLCMGIISVTEWLLLIIAKMRNQKTLIWSHGWLGKDKGLKKLISKIYFSLSNGVLVYNERSTRLMIDGGLSKTKVHTIYNSLNYDMQLSIRKTLISSDLYQKHFSNENKNIVFIGRLMKVKRFDLLLEAVSLLKERGIFVNVTFIGDGDERSGMEKFANVKGILSQIWFYGASFDEKKNAELIYNADLCVSPGNIGLTAMHVMMFGCPAITNDDLDHQMPEFEAIQDGLTGTFFKAGDSCSLATTIEKWFTNHYDDREQVRQACYNVIDLKWNPHNQIAIMDDVLASL